MNENKRRRAELVAPEIVPRLRRRHKIAALQGQTLPQPGSCDL